MFANCDATRLKTRWFDRNGYCLLFTRCIASCWSRCRQVEDTAVQVSATQLGRSLAIRGLMLGIGEGQASPRAAPATKKLVRMGDLSLTGPN